MPAAVAEAAFAAAAEYGATEAVIAYYVAYAATVYALNKALGSLARAPGKTGAGSGLEIGVIDSTADGRIIYGSVRTSGVNVIPALTSNNPSNPNAQDGAILHEILALAAHEVASFGSVYLDDDEIVTGDITAVTASANDGKVTGSTKYAASAWLRRYAGTSTQNVDFILNTAFPTNFTSAFKGRGIAYIASSFDWGKGKVYTGGVPNVSVVVNGKKCYDPRLDVSPGASPTNPAYVAFTSCPALHWADYKMSLTIGQKVASTEVDWTSVVAAANVCDALVAIPTGTTQPRYTFNGVLSSSDDTQDNEKNIIDAMMGKLAFTGGKWRIFAGAWVAPEFSIQKEDWVSIAAIKTTGSRNDTRYNGVVCYHVDPAKKWQRVESYRRYNDTYKSADAGERIWIEMDQPYCLTDYEAQRKSEFLLRQSRNGVKFSGTLPPSFMKLRTWDNVAVTFEELGWVSKTFAVASCVTRSDGAVDVVLLEEQSADWTDLIEADYGAPSTLPAPATNPTRPTEPSSFAVTPLLGTLKFQLGEPVVIPRGMLYQVLRSVGTLATPGSFSVLWEGTANVINLPADPRSNYWYSGRAIANSYVSNLSPNTFGILGRPFINVETSPGNRAYPDGEFVYANNSYWGQRATGLQFITGLVGSGGVSGTRGKFVFDVASGVTGGAGLQVSPLRWDVDSTTSAYGPRVLPGQACVAYVTARAVSSFAVPLNVFAYSFLPNSSGAQPAETTIGSQPVTTAASGEWITSIYTFSIPSSVYDHVRIAVRGPTAYNSNTIGITEIGALQLATF